MTDPKALLTMLDDVHTMQRAGEASVLIVLYHPMSGTLRVQLIDHSGKRYAFLMSSTTDIDKNLEEFCRLKRTWLFYEEQKRNRSHD